MEYVIVAVQRFLRIESGAGDYAESIVNRQMKVPDLSIDQFVRRGVHLLHLAKISASGAPAVGVFYSNQIELYGILFLLRPSCFFKAASSFFTRLRLAFVTLGERMYSFSRIFITDDADIWIPSKRSSNSV